MSMLKNATFQILEKIFQIRTYDPHIISLAVFLKAFIELLLFFNHPLQNKERETLVRKLHYIYLPLKSKSFIRRNFIDVDLSRKGNILMQLHICDNFYYFEIP